MIRHGGPCLHAKPVLAGQIGGSRKKRAPDPTGRAVLAVVRGPDAPLETASLEEPAMSRGHRRLMPAVMSLEGRTLLSTVTNHGGRSSPTSRSRPSITGGPPTPSQSGRSATSTPRSVSWSPAATWTCSTSTAWDGVRSTAPRRLVRPSAPRSRRIRRCSRCSRRPSPKNQLVTSSLSQL